MKDKTFIVTGALGGIGGATAKLLIEAGANVVLSDLSDEGAAAAAALAGGAGQASYFAADVTKEDQVIALVDHAVSRFGALNGAFNNAGVDVAQKPITELSTEEWDRTMRINAQGAFHCVKHQLRAMDGGGSIVNTSSGLGVVGAANCAAYIASKHAVCGLTRAAAVEGAAKGIRVNAILPGIVRTPMIERQYGDLSAPEIVKHIQSVHLLGRLCEPEEVGFLVRWLLSDEASFVTGAMYAVDAGATAV